MFVDEGRVVGGAGLVEINLPVDGSPPLGLESTFAPTLAHQRRPFPPSPLSPADTATHVGPAQFSGVEKTVS